MKVPPPAPHGMVMFRVSAAWGIMEPVHAPHVQINRQTVHIPVLRQLIHVHGLVMPGTKPMVRRAKRVLITTQPKTVRIPKT